MGTIWRAPDGGDAIFIVNTGSQPQRVRFNLSKQAQLKERRTWKIQRMTLDGLEPPFKTKGVIEVELPPHSVMGYQLERG